MYAPRQELFLTPVRKSLVVEPHDINAHVSLVDQLILPFAHGRVACDEFVQALAEQNLLAGDDLAAGLWTVVDECLDVIADEHRREEPLQVHALGE